MDLTQSSWKSVSNYTVEKFKFKAGDRVPKEWYSVKFDARIFPGLYPDVHLKFVQSATVIFEQDRYYVQGIADGEVIRLEGLKGDDVATVAFNVTTVPIEVKLKISIRKNLRVAV